MLSTLKQNFYPTTNTKTDIIILYNGCARSDVACHRWQCKGEDRICLVQSGTIIQEHIWTLPRFSSQSPAFLWVYNHCMLKTSNEVVVEGICMFISKQADSISEAYPSKAMGVRQYKRFSFHFLFTLLYTKLSSLHKYAYEAKIVWNGPLYHEGDEFLKECLDHYFGERNGWHFYNIDKKRRPLVSLFVSKVIDRLMKCVSKSPFMKAKKG